MVELSIEDKAIMIDNFMTKAEKALKTAILLSEDDYDGAANRAYYSVFQCENALLLTKGILSKTHKHTHNSISEEFVKSGKLPFDTHKRIQIVQGIRSTGDYSGTEFVTKEEMEKAISEAKIFFENTNKIIAEFKIEQEK